MIPSIFRIALDLYKATTGLCLQAHGMDYGTRAIQATFMEGDSHYSFGKDASVVFRARNPEDNGVIEVDANIEDNTAYVLVPDAIIDRGGRFICEFVINGVGSGSYHSRSLELHSPTFMIYVREPEL